MRFFILVGLVVGVIAVFAPDEMRCAHRSGWLRPGSSRDRRQRFRPSALVRVLAAETKSVMPCEVPTSGIH